MTETTAGVLTPLSYGRGWPQVIRPGNPAAGAAGVLVTPGDRNRRILAVTATLTTSATVATRVPVLEYADGDGVVWARFRGISTLAASKVAVTQWAVGVSTVATGVTGDDVVGLPDVILPPGHRISVGADALDGTDAVTAVAVWVEEIPIGPGGYPVGVVPATAVPAPATQ